MKRTYDSWDEILHRTLLNDASCAAPKTGIEDRLNYYFLLKHPSGKARSNSFAGMAEWIFSLRSLGLKAALVTGCLAGTLFLGNIRNSSPINVLSDTCHISPLLVDSNYQAKDTTGR